LEVEDRFHPGGGIIKWRVEDGDMDLVLGHLSYQLRDWEPLRTWLTFWENQGLKEEKADDEHDPGHVIDIFSNGDGN
jgi:hypothetical protein